MIRVISKCAGHAAASGLDHVHIEANRAQQLDRGRGTGWQTIIGHALGPLMTVRVKCDLAALYIQVIDSLSSGYPQLIESIGADEKFIDQPRTFRQRIDFCTKFWQK